MPIDPSLYHGGAAPNLCAAYQLTVHERPAANERSNLTPLEPECSFQWLKDGTSSSTVVLPLRGCEADLLPRPWTDELVYERETLAGGSEGVTWRGTVTQVTEDRDAGTLTIVAFDNSVWWSRRQWLTVDITGTWDQADLWRALVVDAERGTPSGVAIGPYRATGREWISTRGVGDENQDLIFERLTAVDWTVIDRTLYGPGPSTVPSEVWDTLVLNEHWIGNGGISDDDGARTVSQVQVVGDDADGDPTVIAFYPAAPATNPLVGFHGLTYRFEREMSQTEADGLAEQIWREDRNGHRFIVTSTDSLSPEAPVTIWDLVPGRVFNVASGPESLFDLVDPFQVYNAVVTLAPSGDGRLLEERVAVDLQPVGSDAVSRDRVSL